MKMSQWRDKSTQELRQSLRESSEELFKLRMQRSTGQEPKPHLFKQVRRRIARIKTIIQEQSRG